MSRSKKSKQDKIELPEEIILKDATVEVLSRSDSWTKESKGLGEYSYAHDGKGPSMKVNTDGTIEEVLDTVLHELLHACVDNYGLKLNFKQEEKIVSRLSNGLSDALINTPGLTKFISKSVAAHIKAQKAKLDNEQ